MERTQAQSRFILKEPNSKNETQVYLMMFFAKERVKYYTGIRVNPAKWNPKTQRLKHIQGSAEINSLLDRIGATAQSILAKHSGKGGIPSHDAIREEIKTTLKGKDSEDRGKGFFEIFDEFIRVKSISGTASATIKTYKTTQNLLEGFETHIKQKIKFDKINLRFFESLADYAVNVRKLNNNSFDKYYKILLTFLRWASDREICEPVGKAIIKTRRTDSDLIYLTSDELRLIEALDLNDLKRLEKVRDLFLFSCYTGLRFSDAVKVKREHIIKSNGGLEGSNSFLLKVFTEKTNDRLIIPLLPKAIGLLEKYEYQLPRITNQKQNEYLKEVGKLAGLNHTHTYTTLHGGEQVEKQGEKWEFLTYHVARRTFVTLSLEKGIRPETLMMATGHKNMKALKPYIKITQGVLESEMLRAWNPEAFKPAKETPFIPFEVTQN